MSVLVDIISGGIVVILPKEMDSPAVFGGTRIVPVANLAKGGACAVPIVGTVTTANSERSGTYVVLASDTGGYESPLVTTIVKSKYRLITQLCCM